MHWVDKKEVASSENNVAQYNGVKVLFLLHKYTQVKLKNDAALKLLLQVQFIQSITVNVVHYYSSLIKNDD